MCFLFESRQLYVVAFSDIRLVQRNRRSMERETKEEEKKHIFSIYLMYLA